jgi:hypothetical protein
MKFDAAALDLDLSAVRSERIKDGYAYWRRLAATRLPARAMIDPAAIPALLPHTVLHGVMRGPLDFVWRLIGVEVRRRMARDLAGRRMSQIEGQGPGSRI